MGDYESAPRPKPASATTQTSAPAPKPKAPGVGVLGRAFHGTKVDVAFKYIQQFEPELVAAFAAVMPRLELPSDPAFSWIATGLQTELAWAFRVAVGGGAFFRFATDALYPDNAEFAVDAHRPLIQGKPGPAVDGKEAVGKLIWYPAVGNALALMFAQRLQESMRRMVPRYVLQLRAKHPDRVAYDELVTSHSMDRVATALLVNPRVTRSTVKERAAPAEEAPAQLFAHGLRPIGKLEYCVKENYALWNWVKVTDPVDATIEEVLAHLFGDPAATYGAHLCVRSGPYFQIEPSWATVDPVMRAAPQRSVQGATNALALADSELATEAAIAQAADERRVDKQGKALPVDRFDLHRTLAHSHRLLDRAHDMLDRWSLRSLVLPALEWTRQHQEHFDSFTDDHLADLGPVFVGQRGVLYDVIAALTATTKVSSPRADGKAGPVHRVLKAYAVAAGESHLIDSAREQLARAKQMDALLVFDLLEDQHRDSARLVGDANELQGNTMAGAAADIRSMGPAIQQFRANAVLGGVVPTEGLDSMASRLEEYAAEARLRTVIEKLWLFVKEASAADDGLAGGAAGVTTDIATMADQARGFAKELEPHLTLHVAEKQALLASAASPADVTKGLRTLAETTERRLAAFIRGKELATTFRGWEDELARQNARTAIAAVIGELLLMIAVSVATSGVASVIGGAARGAVMVGYGRMGVGAVGAAESAQAVGVMVETVADAALMAAVQTGMYGDKYGSGFAEELLGNVGVRAALGALHRTFGALESAEKSAANADLWTRVAGTGEAALKRGARISLDMIVAAGVNYAAHRIVNGERPDEDTAIHWAMQGAAMAIGRFVRGWTHEIDTRLGELGEYGVATRMRVKLLRQDIAKVEASGDEHAAIDLLVKRKEILDDEAKAIEQAVAAGRVDASHGRTIIASNRAESQAASEAGLELMPLRSEGLVPEDASQTVWSGTTEQITRAIYQAERLDVPFDVLKHDAAARQWVVRAGNRQLTLVEVTLKGQPRPARAVSTKANVARAREDAAVAEVMQAKWEALTKREVDAMTIVQTDHLQIGFGYAGVVNQATLPATGDGIAAKLVVYEHRGTLSYRREQDLGQSPDRLDAPGVRVSEQAEPDVRWATSGELDRAIDVGRVEVQTRAYRASVVAIEARPKGVVPPDWAPEAAHRAFRVNVGAGPEQPRWFYTDRIDNVGGLGPGQMTYAQKVTAAGDYAKLVASGAMIAGSDPELRSKLKPGAVLVWGGSATGAWAAEPAIHPPGNAVTVVADNVQKKHNWKELREEYAAIIKRMDQHGVDPISVARLAELDAIRNGALTGLNDRNRQLGSPLNQNPWRDEFNGVHLEFGAPTLVEATPDGKVKVTYGAEADAKTAIYDQVIVAHGQNAAAPGGAGQLLGAGARGNDEVPAGTIQLRPVWGPERNGQRDILALESTDPEGLTIKGAAFGMGHLAPWVRAADRAEYVAAVKAMAHEGAAMRDYAPVSKDSAGVSPGMEVQRERIPRANEVLAAEKYRLPGSAKHLVLDPADQTSWDTQVREFFAEELRANGKWVRVERLAPAREGEVAYRLTVDDLEVGVFRMLPGDGAEEAAALKRLKAAKLQLGTERERGRVGVDGSDLEGAILTTGARGTTVEEMIENLPTNGDREARFKALKGTVQKVGTGMADLHNKLASHRLMSTAAKNDDITALLDTYFGAGATTALTRTALGDDFDRIRASIAGPLKDAFLAAEVPSTAAHGQADASHFAVADGDVHLVDSHLLARSMDDRGRGTGSSAADVQQFIASLERFNGHGLSSDEIEALTTEFSKAFNGLIKLKASAAANDWYRVAALVKSVAHDPGARTRLTAELGASR